MSVARWDRLALVAGLLVPWTDCAAQVVHDVDIRPNAAQYVTSGLREGVVVVRGSSHDANSTDPRYVLSVIGPITRNGALVPARFGIADAAHGGATFHMPLLGSGFIFSTMRTQPVALQRQTVYREEIDRLEGMIEEFDEARVAELVAISPQTWDVLKPLLDPVGPAVQNAPDLAAILAALRSSLKEGRALRSQVVSSLETSRAEIRQQAEQDTMIRVAYARGAALPDQPDQPDQPDPHDLFSAQPAARWLRFFISKYALGAAEGTEVLVFAYQVTIAGVVTDVTIIANVSAPNDKVKVDWLEPPQDGLDEPTPDGCELFPGEMIRLEADANSGTEYARDVGGKQNYSAVPEVCAMVNEAREIVMAVTNPQIVIPQCVGSSTGGGSSPAPNP